MAPWDRPSGPACPRISLRERESAFQVGECGDDLGLLGRDGQAHRAVSVDEVRQDAEVAGGRREGELYRIRRRLRCRRAPVARRSPGRTDSRRAFAGADLRGSSVWGSRCDQWKGLRAESLGTGCRATQVVDRQGVGLFNGRRGAGAAACTKPITAGVGIPRPAQPPDSPAVRHNDPSFAMPTSEP